LIPVLNKHGDTRKLIDRKTQVSAKAFVFVYAVQIPLFPPMDWDRDRSYSRDDQQYAHRFPTPATCGGGTGAEAADLFSMEDLHRTILMFYFHIGRRVLANSLYLATVSEIE